MLLIGVVWLTQSLKLINLITTRGIDFISFLKIASMLVIPLAYLVIPIAFFIAVMLFIHSSISDRELVVMKASGMSNFQIAKPIIVLALIFTVINYAISFYFLPKSYREFKDMQELFKNKYLSLLLEEGIFNTQVKNMTVYIDSKDDDGVFNGIFIYDARNAAKPVTIMADSGMIIKNDFGPEFVLNNGTHQEENKKTGHVSMILFDKYRFDLSLFIGAGDSKRPLDANEMYISELFEGQEDIKSENEFFVQGNQRLVWPLYVLILGILSSAVMMSGSYSRKQLWEKNFTTTAVCSMPIIFSLMFNNMALRNVNLVFLMHLNCIIFLVLGIFLFIKPMAISYIVKLIKKT